MDGAIPGLAEPDEVVILGHDLARWAGEVDGQRGHCAAEVIDVEDQIGIEILKLAPDDPAHARIDQAVLVARSVDGFDAWQAKVPEQVRLEERRDEAAAGAIDVDGNVEAGLLLEAVESGAQRENVFVVSGKGAAEHGDHSDGVLVAGLRGALRIGDHFVAFERNLARLHVPIAGELVPADLSV